MMISPMVREFSMSLSGTFIPNSSSSAIASSTTSSESAPSAVALFVGLLQLVLSMASCSSPGPALEGDGVGTQDAGRASLAYSFQRVSRAATWEPVETILLDFKTFHPQGLVRTKSHLYISSVEILERPRLDPNAIPGEPDRSEGRGRAHLFKVDPSGHLVQDLALGEATRAIYHPGGMGIDGLWVPAAAGDGDRVRPPAQSGRRSLVLLDYPEPGSVMAEPVLFLEGDNEPA